MENRWFLKTTTSLFNKITLILESKLGSDSFDWDEGVKRYTRQKGLLTVDESIFGPPNSDTEEATNRVELVRVPKPKKSKSKKKAKSSSFKKISLSD